MKRPSEIGRRRYVQGLAAAAIVGGVPVAAGGGRDGSGGSTAAGGRGGRGGGPPEEVPVAQPFVGDLDGLPGEGIGTDSGDMTFDVENRYDGDPADEGRDWVVHYTSDGAETQDYPAALINLRERLETTVTFDDLDELGEEEFAFDFLVGKGHKQYIPGQVYLVIRTPDQIEAGGDEAWGLYKNVRRARDRDGVEPADFEHQWHTLDVAEEMADGTDAPWRALVIDVDPERFRAEFESFSEAILEQAVRTRDERGETFESLLGTLDGDTQLLAAGLGSGSSSTPTQRDIYFDDYRITVDGEEHVFELPAALRMNADFDSDGRITATLSFETDPDEEEFDLSDVDEDSVRLYPFSQVMPPMGDGVEPNRVDVSDDGLEVWFPPGRVRGLEGIGGGRRSVVVAGEFDYEHVVWFFGIGQADVPGN